MTRIKVVLFSILFTLQHISPVFALKCNFGLGKTRKHRNMGLKLNIQEESNNILTDNAESLTSTSQNTLSSLQFNTIRYSDQILQEVSHKTLDISNSIFGFLAQFSNYLVSYLRAQAGFISGYNVNLEQFKSFIQDPVINKEVLIIITAIVLILDSIFTKFESTNALSIKDSEIETLSKIISVKESQFDFLDKKSKDLDIANQALTDKVTLIEQEFNSKLKDLETSKALSDAFKSNEIRDLNENINKKSKEIEEIQNYLNQITLENEELKKKILVDDEKLWEQSKNGSSQKDFDPSTG
jgi:hypothetical protein